jgi:membrane-bound lytic murein transglycosylase D
MPVDEFLSLNPGNSRPVIKADGERVLLFPADKADTFRSNMENHDAPLVSWQAYKLKPGETGERVAARYGISVAQLKQVNGIAPKRGIGAGATLLVPSGSNATPYLPDLPAPRVTVARAPKKSAKHAARKGGATKAAHKTAKKTAVTKKKTAAANAKKVALAEKPR